MPVRNKVKVRELDWVVECSDAVVVASYAGDECEKVPLADGLDYDLVKTKLRISKIEFVKPDLPERFGVLAAGGEVAVNPADLSKLLDQRKIFHTQHKTKNLLLNSYGASEPISDRTSSEERVYFLTMTMKGWGFPCKDASESKSNISMVQAQLRASYPRTYS